MLGLFIRSLGLVMMLVGTCLAEGGSVDGSDAARIEFFESKVRPILAGRCFDCHGEEKQRGGLRLDSSEAIRAGGDTGPAIDLDDPTQSPLIEAIRHEGPYKMPPKGKLDDAEIDALTKWVRQVASLARGRCERPPALSRPTTRPRPSPTPIDLSGRSSRCGTSPRPP